jgi:hypothetical protein
MNNAMISEMKRMLELWKCQARRFSRPFELVLSDCSYTAITEETDLSNEVLQRWLFDKLGNVTTGPVGMSVLERMLNAKGLCLRLIYKPQLIMKKKSKKSDDGEVPVWMFPRKRIHEYRDEYYAGLNEIDMLRDSGMSLVMLMFNMNKKKKDNDGHVIISQGDGLVVSNFMNDTMASRDSTVRAVNGGPFTVETLLRLVGVPLKQEDKKGKEKKGEKDEEKKVNIQMTVYEVVPRVLLEERKRKYHTPCAEALLHQVSVPGCSRVVKNKVHHLYKKSYHNWPFSKCIKVGETMNEVTSSVVVGDSCTVESITLADYSSSKRNRKKKVAATKRAITEVVDEVTNTAGSRKRAKKSNDTSKKTNARK